MEQPKNTGIESETIHDALWGNYRSLADLRGYPDGFTAPPEKDGVPIWSRPMNRVIKNLLSICFFCFIVAHCISVNAGQNKSPGHETDALLVTAGIDSHFVTGVGVDIKDLKIGVELMVKELGEKFGFKAISHVYENPDILMKDLQKGKLDIVYTTSPNYLLYEQQVAMDLAHVPMIGGSTAYRYQVLVSSDSKAATIMDLEGKILAVMKDDLIGDIYLNTLLLRNKQQESERFFQSVIEKKKQSRAILSVFFGKADACIAAEGVFKTMVELNPQIDKKLKTISSSQKIIPGVVSYRKGYPKKLQKLVSTSLLDLHKTPRGKQILVLFKTDCLVMAKESDLGSIKSLLDEYNSLKEDIKVQTH